MQRYRSEGPGGGCRDSSAIGWHCWYPSGTNQRVLRQRKSIGAAEMLGLACFVLILTVVLGVQAWLQPACYENPGKRLARTPAPCLPSMYIMFTVISDEILTGVFDKTLFSRQGITHHALHLAFWKLLPQESLKTSFLCWVCLFFFLTLIFFYHFQRELEDTFLLPLQRLKR